MSRALSTRVVRDRQDYLSAVWLNFWRSGGWLWPFGLTVAVGVWTFLEGQGESDVVGAAGGAFACAALVAGVMWILYAGMASGTASRAARIPGALESTDYEFSQDSLKVRSPVAESASQWSVFKSAFENKRVLVVRQHANALLVLPKRCLDGDVEPRLKSLLRSVLGKRAAFQGAGQ